MWMSCAPAKDLPAVRYALSRNAPAQALRCQAAMAERAFFGTLLPPALMWVLGFSQLR